MSKITLSDVTSLANEQSFISTTNTNSATIETASDGFLSRDGTSPNSMEADFDMNSFEILNIGDLDMNGHRLTGLDDAVADDEAVPYSQVLSIVETATSSGSLIRDMVAEVCMTGNGSVLSTGIQGDFSIPFACTITGWRLLGDQSGSLVIDLWKNTYSNYPPTVANTITAGSKPTLSSAIKNENTTLTGWTTSISAGDTIRFNIDSVSAITRAVLALTLRKAS